MQFFSILDLLFIISFTNKVHMYFFKNLNLILFTIEQPIAFMEDLVEVRC